MRARAYSCTVLHFIFILATSTNELASSRGPTDLCKRPFLGRVFRILENIFYFASEYGSLGLRLVYEKRDGATGSTDGRMLFF